MSKSVDVSRIISLLVLLMAGVVVLSGPVAGVLDLPESTAEAKKKHKKKKKKNRPKRPAFNVVNCADVGFTCNGTAFNDFLIGTPGAESIFGGEGNDVYQANGGNSFLIDRSVTSSDYYTAIDPGEGRNTVITDSGGPGDSLDMGSFKALDDVEVVRFNNSAPGDADDLILAFERPEGGVVRVTDYFRSGRIETIRFANGSITGAQVQSMAREATPEEQAALEEQAGLEEGLSEEERSYRSFQDKESPEKE